MMAWKGVFRPGPNSALDEHDGDDDAENSNDELQLLAELLHFPEEVALRLTDTEYRLFYQVPPVDYLRQVTLDLDGEGIFGDRYNPPNPGRRSLPNLEPRRSVRSLIKRFNQVSEWVVELINSQTGEKRKVALGRILRVAVTCWNIGNFNGAMEIVAGLKSQKLSGFWHDIGSEPLPALDFLSAALISAEYEHALGRALAIPECRLVPFFGAFIQELREILSSTPVLTRQSTTPTSIHEEELAVDEMRGPSKNISQPPPEKMSFQRDPMDSINSDSIEEIERDPIDRLQRKQVFIASANEEGQQSSRWTRGPDGLVNLERVYKTQAVMDHIATFHQHHHTLTKTQPPILGDFLRKIMPTCDEPIFIQRPQKTVTADFEYEALYEVEKCGYCPVQPLPHDHGVTMFPLVTRDGKRMDKHILQIMQHGTTCVVGAGETDWPGAVVHLRLERGASVLSWCKTGHTPLKHGEYLSSTAQHPELSLSFNPEEVMPLKFRAKLSHYSQAGIIGNEGFIDLEFVKDMRVHGVLVEPREIMDMTAAARKSGLEVCEGPPNMITLVYGRNLSDNRTVHFLLPLSSFRIWAVGLHSVMRALIAQAKLPDRSLTWLKNKYIGLYYEDGCCSEPLVSDAIRVFGGKIASSGTTNTTPARRSGAESRSSLFKKNMSTPEFKRSPLSFCSTRTRGYQAPRHSSYSSAMSYFRSSAPRHSSLTTTATNIMVRSPNSSGSPSFLRLLSGWTRSRTRARDALQRLETSERFWQNLKHLQAGPVGYETQLNFLDFVSLFRSFSLVLRTELRELFEQLAAPYEPSSHPERSQSSPELHQAKPQFRFGIQSELSGMVMGVSTLRKFCETRQEEIKTDEELIDIVQRHEPDPILRADNCLSFEGFVRYICDKDNYAFLPEQKRIDFVNKQQKLENNKDAVLMKEMTGSLSQYFIASSHNTYLIGHQLKGESSIEIYSQVLLSGCRCVELDCWDGDDGNPVIYHGHTFTSKISFRRVVETIARSAFVTSPYPIILSIENHCSVPQQQVMANIFEAVFGDKLVTNFLFDSDYSEEPKLPSPEQLKYKVLIKNKKLPSSDGNLAGPSSANQGPILPTPNKSRSNIFSLHLPNLFSCINPFKRRSSHPNLADDEEAMEIRSDGIRNTSTSLPEQGRTNCISSPQSNSANNYLAEDSSDEEYDEDDELDGDFRIPITETEINKAMSSAENRWCRVSASLYAQWKGEGGGGRKGSNQIAKELSDMIVYVQAVKYRGLKPLPPKSSTNQSTAEHEEEPEPVPGTSYESSENCESTNKHIQQSARTRNTPQTHHPCYSCTSMSEPFIRRVARRNPPKVVAHTESQLIRTYPAAMRIDSSNTDPTQYWAYGVQLVALNYQTDDPAMSVNTAMYESNALTGYVRKPSVMWDPNHIAYRRFNPMSKEFDGVHANYMFLGVISGQYVAEHIYSFYNSFVVVEVLGVPADYTKVKTKVTQKNALNPLWNDNFHFKINFPELAFIRFEVFDADTNYKLSQRVIKLSCLEPGYRHVKLKTPNNQHLNMASLLIYSRRTEEFSTKIVDGNLEDKKLHFLVVHGVTTQESYSIFKVTEDTTAAETIEMCLGKSGFYGGKESGCVLVEEIATRAPTQRVLADHEKVLKVATSKLAPKLLLKRVGNDPSSRAWLTSIGNTSADRSKEKTDQDEGATALDDDSDDYYVCVYNVSPEIPYAIIKIPLFETASYLIEQALTKARCEDDPKKFVLVEEMEKYTRSGTELVQRTLADDEIVYFAQAAWKNLGKFSIQERGCTVPVPRHRAAIAKIQRGLSITRGAISASTGLPLGGYTECNESKLPIPTARTEPTQNSCRRASTIPLARGITRAQGHSAKEMRSSREDSATNREVHSDGETAAGGSMGSESMREHVARFKRLSLRRLRGWRS